MINTIYYGASGRIGGLLEENQIKGRVFFAKRGGWFQENGLLIQQEQLLRDIYGHGVRLIDFSIDYSNSSNMLLHEQQKKDFFEILLEVTKVQCFVGISSGAAQFPLHIIKNEFYKKYSQFKSEHSKFLDSLNIPVFYPQLFTLIGKRSFSYKTTGWVNVIEQAKNGGIVEISDPYELRSWVSEVTLQRYILNFLNNPSGKFFSAIVDGNFCLYELVEIINRLSGNQSQIRINKKSKWLPIAYINQLAPVLSGNLAFEKVISDILKSN
jgi:hypothetical protein